MAAQFPIVKKLVGDNFFLALARDYVREEPPVEPALTFYGETFPTFIAGHSHCRPLPYLPDVARLEWLCQHVLHAAEDSTMHPAVLVNVEPEILGDVNLHLKHAVALLRSAYPVVEIREQNLNEEAGSIDIATTQPSNALIYRDGSQVKVISLNPSAFLFLDQLRQGQVISACWETVSSTFSLNDEALPHLLGSLLGLGVFSGYAIKSEESP